MKIKYDEGFIPFPWQKEVYLSKNQYKIVRVGRRAGKTELGVRWIANHVRGTGKDGLVVAKDYGMLRDTHLPYFTKLLGPLIEAKICVLNKSEMAFNIKDRGSIILRSAENPDRLRGLGKNIGRIWLDEFAFAPQQKYLYNEILGFYQLDHPIEVLVTSTPHGHDFFWEICERGKNDSMKKYKEYHFTSYSNPLITREDIKNLIKENDWGPIEILENIEADFGDISTGVFGDYSAIAEDYKYGIEPSPKHTYIMSVDLATVGEDWTVIYIMDVSVKPAKVVEKRRIQRIDPVKLEELIIKLSKEYNGAKVFTDYTNEKNTTDRLKKKLTVQGITFTSKSKPEMVQNLAYMIHKELFVYSKYDIDLKNELSVFRAKRSQEGHIKYSAPYGYHDDCVCSMMLLLRGAKSKLISSGEVPPQVVGKEYLPYRDMGKKIKEISDFYKVLKR